MNTITAGSGTLLIGRQGENNATMVLFPVKSLIERYGELTFTLVVRRPGESLPYSVAVDSDDEYAAWTVSSYDTGLHGIGRCELQCFDSSGTVVKSNTWITKVTESITDGRTSKASGGTVATDAEVREALDELLARHSSGERKVGG